MNSFAHNGIVGYNGNSVAYPGNRLELFNGGIVA